MIVLVVKLIASILATGLAAWIIILQTEKRTKVLAAIVCLWAVANVVEQSIEISHVEKKPNLILDKKDNNYDDMANPTIMHVAMLLKNVGDADANKVHYIYKAFVGDAVVFEEENKIEPTLRPGSVGVIKWYIKDEPFKQAWTGEKQLKDNLVVTYVDDSQKKYTFISNSVFRRKKNSALQPAWQILED